jgi:hypothetical protein
VLTRELAMQVVEQANPLLLAALMVGGLPEAQLGNAVWGVLDTIGRKNQNGSEGALSKPFHIN